MSGTLPTTQGPAQVVERYDRGIIREYAESGASQARDTGGITVEFEFIYDPMPKHLFRELWAFLLSQAGAYESFTLVVPDKATPLGVATGTPLVNGAHSAGVSSIATDGWTPNTTNILKAGDILKFGGHSQVYTNLTNINSGATTGPATIVLDRPLEAALADNESITVNNVEYTVNLIGGPSEHKTLNPFLSALSFRVREYR